MTITVWMYQENINSFWQRIIVTLLGFLLGSFLKVLSGSTYPSDALITLPVCALNIGMFQGIILLIDSNRSFTTLSLITRPTFIHYIELNNFEHTKYICLAFLLIVLLMCIRPISMFKKTPLWMATPISFYIFNRVLMYPTEENGYS